MKILVVDDSRILRQRIISLISDIPGVVIVAEAESSVDAMKHIEKLKPDVMIMDIRMPNGSGIELLKNTQNKYDSLIKIVLTNYPLLQYKEKCLELGANYFFDKSSETENVRKVLEKITSNYQA